MSARDRLARLTADLIAPAGPTTTPAATQPAEPPAVGPGEQPPPVPDVGAAAASAIAPDPPAQRPMETRFPEVFPRAAGRRTGPGEMLAVRTHMLAAESELQELQQRLKEHDGSLPTRKLDPQDIVPSRWANRHEDSFKSTEFRNFKEEIEHAGGNVQPVLVRPIKGQPGKYELIFGHRRHRACLELGLPVLGYVWTDALPDLELFALMDRENRHRADLTGWEQGSMYKRALDEGLFPSQRRLADHLGVSHTWVRKAVTVADLPEAIVQCFRSPLEITYRHAEELNTCMSTDRKGVLRRAEKLRQSDRMTAGAVVAALVGKQRVPGAGARDIRSHDKLVGRLTWDAKGRAVLTMLPGTVTEQNADALIAAIAKIAAA